MDNTPLNYPDIRMAYMQRTGQGMGQAMPQGPEMGGSPGSMPPPPGGAPGAQPFDEHSAILKALIGRLNKHPVAGIPQTMPPQPAPQSPVSPMM